MYARGKFIEKYQLENNEWLLGLYGERHRWVPAFVRDIFWAGMSTTQRSESMHAFFDGYINSNTTLKQFVEQYENALAKKVENEKQEEFNSYNSCYPCATPLGMEKQFQSVYTRAKFKEFQNELFGKLCCHLVLIKADVGFRDYEVRERVRVRDGHRSATFKLIFYNNTKEVNCNCRLFEFRGIMCRHQLMVYNDMEIYDEVPAKYILQRWSKNVKRRYTKIRISYDNWSDRPEACRFDKMCNLFYELGEVAAESEAWCDEVIAQIHQMKEGYKEKAAICGSNMPMFTNHSSNSTSHGDGIVHTKESTNILDPFVTRSKGRPPSKRKVGNVEKAVKKHSKAKKKTKTSTSAKV